MRIFFFYTDLLSIETPSTLVRTDLAYLLQFQQGLGRKPRQLVPFLLQHRSFLLSAHFNFTLLFPISLSFMMFSVAHHHSCSPSLLYSTLCFCHAFIKFLVSSHLTSHLTSSHISVDITVGLSKEDPLYKQKKSFLDSSGRLVSTKSKVIRPAPVPHTATQDHQTAIHLSYQHLGCSHYYDVQSYCPSPIAFNYMP